MDQLRILSDIVERGAARHEHRVALEVAQGRTVLSYGALRDRVRRGSGALRALGLARGDRVVIALDGSPEWPVAFCSAMHADLCVVPIPPRMPPEIVAKVAFHVSARAAIFDAPCESSRLIPADVRELTVADLAVGCVRDAGPESEPHDRALLAFTSGSTSRPHAVELTHDNLLANLRALESVRQPDADETLLSVLPPAHLFELVVGQLAPLSVGARIVYGGAPLPNRLVAAIRDRRITRAILVPALFEALCREAIEGLAQDGAIDAACRSLTAGDLAIRARRMAGGERARVRAALRARIGETLRTVAVGGAALNPAWADVLAAMDIGLDVGYGLTEAGPLVSLGLATRMPSGSVGRPLPGVDVRVDERGEIFVRSEGVMRGYFRDRNATAGALANGWLRTGDRGHLDEHGFLFVSGRLKEAIVTAGGDTLSPDEIEPYYASPLFAEHCVVPGSGPDGNDVPLLVVVPSQADTTDQELHHVFARLRADAPDRFRAAAVIRWPRTLPRTPAGKVRRRALADAVGPVRS
jgi:long-chain acyl-CoA synthetase